MQIVEILIVGTNKPIMETIARLIDKDGKWRATIAFSMEQALTICLENFGLVLIGAGLKEEDEVKLKQQLAEIKPNLPIIKHYGGGSGLLFAEIYQGLGT